MSILSALHVILLLTAPLITVTALPPPLCEHSTEPDICRSVISQLRSTPGSYAYGLLAVNRSVEARESAHLLTSFGAKTGRVDGSAIDDCLELTEMSVDDLETVRDELAAGEPAMTEETVDRVRTMMSSALTNSDTCLDGLEEESKSSGEIYEHMHEASRLYSVALSLVAQAMDQVETKWPARDPRPVPSISPAAAKPSILLAVIDGVPPNRTVTVAKDGSGNFTSVTEAVLSAPEKASLKDGYFKIIVKEGVYHENVLITKNKKGLILVGAGNNRTIITGNRSTADGWRTFTTATFAVHGERFIAYKLTLENTAGPDKEQAVAVRNSADYSIFYKCTFLGYQDTLYVHRQRQFYRDCDIFGTVDFIFGDAAAVFQSCHIYARKPMPHQKNTITAQGRKNPNDKTGISIHDSWVLAAPDLRMDLGSTKTYLGRPWKRHSRTVFMQSFLDDLIEPEGWVAWDDNRGLKTLYFGEFENYGPGADTSGRVQWPGYRRMEVAEAVNFTVINFISGDAWLGKTSIPFVPGLL